MKKLTLLAAIAALFVGIVGCAEEDNAVDNDTVAPAETTPTE